MKLRSSVRAVALVLCIGSVTTGCTQATGVIFGTPFKFHCPQPSAPGLAIAIGSRADSPAPMVPVEVRRQIVTATQGCGRITVVRVDGRPSVVDSITFGTAAKTQQNFDIDQANFLKKVDDLIASADAKRPEANDLQALSVASGAAGSGGTVALIDSGVQTTDPLDFRKNNLPSRRPAAIVDALVRQHLLPDLSGRSVILAGLGYTAAPQGALADKARAFLVDLWRGIASAAVAKDPTIVGDPNTNGSAVTSPSVSVVTFPAQAIQLACNSLSVLPDSGEVGFVPDKATFRNLVAAKAVLQRFVGFLRNNPTAHVQIDGYVAHYGAGDLSQRRADQVKQELVSLGATSPIAAKGMGWGPNPSPTAPPGVRYDQLNRQVTIEISC